MKIKTAKYEDAGEGRLRLTIIFAEAELPPARVIDEDAFRWALRDWPGVYIGSDFEDILPLQQIAGNSLRGISTERDVLKLAKKFHADLAAGTAEPKELDVKEILGAA